jgi:hypothetical protein
MRFVKAICCAAALTAVMAPGARADEWDKKTILTFSGPVQIPGATLPAGSYVFKLADIPGNRHVVQVFDKDEKKIFTTMLAVPNQRMEPSDKPIVLFSERASGSPQAVKVWYYPGDRIGNEFVYPKSQAMRIAKESHTRVLAMNNDDKTANTVGEIPVEMKSAAVGYFDENGNWQSDADHPVVTSTAPTTVAAETTRAPAPMMASTESAGTTGSRPARKHLPRTSSSLALFELISGLSLAGGFAVRQLRERLS